MDREEKGVPFSLRKKDVAMKNVISVNLKKDQIIFKIAEDAEQKSIIQVLNKKLTELKKQYKE